eukprot:GSMAST32.ASY1.ANO1.2786.1 assembled CDS
MSTSPNFNSSPTAFGDDLNETPFEDDTMYRPQGYQTTSGITALAGKGTECLIPYRGDDQEVRHLKLMGDYGKVVFHPFHAKDTNSVRQAMERSDVVINLIGKHYETKHVLPFMINNSFHDTHVKAAGTIAKCAKEMGVKQLIHVSALASSENSPSAWARSKAEGEKAVRSEFPEATIVRPATMFGDEDRFLNAYAVAARAAPRFALPNGGTAKVQPVFCHDVADAIEKMVRNPNVVGKTFDLAGPDVLTAKECVEFVFRTIKRPPTVVDLPNAVLMASAFVAELLPNPVTTRDKLILDMENITIADCGDRQHLDWSDLGMDVSKDVTKMRDVSIRFLHQYRMGGHFIEVQ